MTFTGKILVVFILVLCIGCMFLSISVYVAQQNWPEEYGKLEAQNRTLQNDLQTARSKQQEAEGQLGQTKKDLQEQIAALETRLAGLEGERDQLRASESAALAQLATFQEQANQSLAEAIFRRDETNALREKLELSIIERDQAVNDRTLAEDARTVAQQQLDTAEQRNKDLLSRESKLVNLLVFYDIDPDQPAKPTTPPDVEGVVENTSDASDLVQISIGGDDGIERRHRLHAVRPGPSPERAKYLGQLEIVEVYPDRSIGKFLRPRKGKIRKGDHVTSKLQ